MDIRTAAVDVIKAREAELETLLRTFLGEIETEEAAILAADLDPVDSAGLRGRVREVRQNTGTILSLQRYLPASP